MTFSGIKNFFEVHGDDFRKELGDRGITLSNFVEFGNIAKRHAPTLKVQAFAEAIKNKGVNSNLECPSAEQYQAADQTVLK